MADDKRCSRCGEVKPLDAFNVANRAKGTRHKWCRACFSDYNRTRYNSRREEFKAAERERYWADPERARRIMRESRARHVEARRADAREYQRTHDRRDYKADWLKADRAANPGKYTERGRAYRKANREADNEKARRYRTRKLAATLAEVTADQLDRKWKRYKGRCWMCGEPAVEWDHVRPLTKGGAHALRNLRPACRPCNASKGDVWPFPTVI
jgi:5-methylcytosine-specific restriction endonuclease McrA